jgi:acyl-CoA thioesterase-1
MRQNIYRAASVIACVFPLACRAAPDAARRDDAAVAARPAAAAKPVVLFIGTSLTAGLGVEADSAYPAIIGRRLDSLHLPLRAVNAGVSGETSAGALRRMGWILQERPAAVVLETGANDGLRGLDADSTRANIEAIIDAIRTRDSIVPIVLVGMEAPPNMGAPFTRRFRAIFPELARRHRLPLVPFLLAGVGGIDSLNQADGIHPTPAGHRIVAENVWRVLGPIVTALPRPDTTP